jgi:hypothetical protein
MKIASFKQIIVLVALTIMSSMAMAQETKVTYADNLGRPGFNLDSQCPSGIKVTFSVNEFTFNHRSINGDNLNVVELSGNFLPNNEGAPDLPSSAKYIAIPQGAKAVFTITRMQKEVFQNIDMAPAPRIPLDTERGPLQYNKDLSIYTKNEFYPAEPVRLGKPSKIRGIDVVMLGISPFQYNPVTKELILYRDLEVEVSFVGGNGQFGEEKYRSRWWDPILQDAIYNSAMLPVVDYGKRSANRSPNDIGFEYLIITPNDLIFQQWADSIKLFRNRQGINTGVVTLATIGGNTTAAIESYINNAYNTWSTPPAAVLLLGDFGTNAANSITSPIWDNYCVSDNIYADVDNDQMPEIAFARITANTAAQLEVMIHKFMNYEKNPPTSPDFYDHPITALGWQTERWFQICSEVIGGFWKNELNKNPVRINAVYQGNPNSDPWSSATNTSTVINYFGPNGLNYIPATPQELGGWTGGTATGVNNALNAGSFMLQHRDHGMETGWGEPSYTNSNIDGLTNTDLSFIMSINCLTGKYNWSSECFAEKFHRYTHNGIPAGALGLIAASETSYSFVNDTYVWGMMDNMWPDFMPSYGAMFQERGILPAFGNCAGKYFLQQSSWPYNTENKEVTYNLFHHHGDAFLTVYSEVPQQLTVSHPAIILAGVPNFSVTSNAGSFIALSVNGQIIGTGEGTGSPVSVSIAPQSVGTMVHITITKQNYYRYDAELLVISPDGPYIMADSYTINDAAGNNNGHLDTGEDAFLTLNLENLGNAATTDCNVTLSTTDPFISLTDNSENYGIIPAHQSLSVLDGFRVSVSGNVPNMHSALITVNATNGSETWTSYITADLYAPVLVVGDISIDDATGNNNGRLDAGETVNIHISSFNQGGCAALNTLGSLSVTSGYLTLNNSTFNLGTLGVIGSVDAIFNVTVDPSTPLGAEIGLDYTVNSGSYSSQKTFIVQSGLIVEDWESGNFTKFNWIAGGNQPWMLTGSGTYEGSYSAKSGTISNSQSSQLILSYNVPANDSISFYLKVSSEENNDKLKFYIDTQEKGNWSGNQYWQRASFPLTQGTHTLKWIYSKNSSASSGSDCAWLDFIVLPAPLITTAYAGSDDYSCGNSSYELAGNAANFSTVQWSTSGTGTFNHPTALSSLYYPSETDVASGSVTLTLSVNGVSGIATDQMILHFEQPAEAYAGINSTLCSGLSFIADETTAQNYSSLHWATSGSGSFTDPTILNATYQPSEDDIATGSVTLTLIAANHSCEPATSSILLTILPTPTAEIIGETTLCEYAPGLIYSAPSTSGNIYSWLVDGGTIAAGAGTNQVIIDWGAATTGSITLNVVSVAGCGNAANVSVLLNALPTPEINGPVVVCSSLTPVAYTTPFTTNTFNWEITGGTLSSGQGTNEVQIVWETPGPGSISVTEIIEATQCQKTLEIPVTINSVVTTPAVPTGPASVDVHTVTSSEYTVVPVATAETYTWQFSPSTAGIISGTATAATVVWDADFRGTASISVRAANGCGESEFSQLLTVNVFSSLGINDPEGNSGISISPNPNNGKFILKLNLGNSQKVSYQITNSAGQVLLHKENIQVNPNYSEEIFLDKVTSGSYYLRIENNGRILVKPFIIR